MLSFVAAVLCEDMYFICNDKNLTAKKMGGETVDNVLDNMLAEQFVIKVDIPFPYTYKPLQQIKVTLSTMEPTSRISIKQFIIVARLPCKECSKAPEGNWLMSPDIARTGKCTETGTENGFAYEANSTVTKHLISGIWLAVEKPLTIEFVASVIASNGKVYRNIRSSLLEPVAMTQITDETDVQYDPREMEQEPDIDNEDEEAGVNTEDEESEPQGPDENENPNETEEWEEKQRQESLEHDMQQDTDHGRAAEEEMKIKEEERRRQLIQAEDAESESQWVSEKYAEMKRMEEEFQKEMTEYEKYTSEEDKKRQELIEWEIKDKEEHDRLMAENEANRTPKEPKDKEEIDINEVIMVEDKVTAGSTAIISSVLMVIVAAIFNIVL